MNAEQRARPATILVLIALSPVVAMPLAEEKERPGYLSPPELMKLAESSSQTYTVNTIEGLKGVGVDEFAALYWPAKGAATPHPRVGVPAAGERTLGTYELGEGCITLIREGDALFEEKKYAEALPIYARATQQFPGCYVAYSHVGDCHYLQGNSSEALKWYDQAADMNPHDFHGPFYRGSALFKLRRFSDARAAYTRALALRPHHETVVQAIRSRADELGLQIVDQPFMPRALARLEGSDIGVYFDPDRPHWLVYGLCKGVWIGEPKHRQEQTGRTEHEWSLNEERQCLGSMLDNYFGLREAGSAELDPEMERLMRILESGALDGFVIYEIAYRLSPDVTLMLTEELFEDVLAYVDRHVLVGKPPEPPPGAPGAP